MGTLVPSDEICLEIEKQPTSPLVEQSSGDKLLLGTPRSRMTKTPLSYVSIENIYPFGVKKILLSD
uniref:Uncharacterized protein n=1 Tax=Arundo donax TaxID=35708 RepID=A0A0A9H0S4_ARUDO